jgi:hypothetical protein
MAARARPMISMIAPSFGDPQPPMAAAGAPPVTAFGLQDNQDGGFTIWGRNDQGNRVDVSNVAALSEVVSDAPDVLTIGEVSGMHVKTSGVKEGTAHVTARATWADGSTGPFSITLTGTVENNPNVQGLGVTFDEPTIRPA